MGSTDARRDEQNSGSDMARRSGKQIDAVRVEALADRLRHAIDDAEGFRAAVSDIETDSTLTAADVVAIAASFAKRSGIKTRKDAVVAIAQERLRRMHGLAKASSAARSKTW